MRVFLLLATLAAAGPFPDLVRSLEVIPKGITLTGKPIAAARWTDKLGTNVLVLAETARVGAASGGSKTLFGYHFVQEGTSWRQLWRTTDAVSNCEFDLELQYVPASVKVTDLDANGTAETTFAYTKTCTSDVSPSELKVLMHEGERKYALRGNTRVQVGLDEQGRKQFEGGERKVDPAFARAPASFLAHAEKIFDASGGK